MSIYERLGVRPVINAVGTQTRLGGTIMCPEAVQAMVEASRIDVAIEELQAAASRVIGRHTGAEAGLVTSGAFAALALATGACITRLDVARMNRMPRYAYEAGCEVIICRHHRNSYDKAFEVAGARLVDVGLLDRALGVGVREVEPEEIEAEITPRTVALAYVAMQGVGPALAALVETAHRHNLPVIVDAANQVPPVRNLRGFIAEGADLVAMSGGKAFRGPQSTGFLCGRRELVAAALLQQLDMDVAPAAWTPPRELVPERLAGTPRHGFGRGFKVGKEEIAGALAALETFVAKEPQYQGEWSERCLNLVAGLGGLDGLEAVYLDQATTGRVPLVELTFTPGLQAQAVARALREGQPSIHLNERRAADGTLIFNPVGLDHGQEKEVVEGLRRILVSGGQTS
ncbi:MAG: aminotransferase class V-fold PLP-dependent enzyme [Candidatus Rokuibacteriota bacterium]